MTGTPPPKPPSAIDGYRRLERTRGAAAPRQRRRARSPHVAGVLRLIGFVAVLAIIVGTSVGLASADPRGADRSPTTRSAPTAPLAKVSAPTKAAATDHAPSARMSRVRDDETSTYETPTPVAAAPIRAAAAASGEALPFTGMAQLDRMLLGGAGLVLLGMLLQIAGQPLPHPSQRART